EWPLSSFPRIDGGNEVLPATEVECLLLVQFCAAPCPVCWHGDAVQAIALEDQSVGVGVAFALRFKPALDAAPQRGAVRRPKVLRCRGSGQDLRAYTEATEKLAYMRVHNHDKKVNVVGTCRAN